MKKSFRILLKMFLIILVVILSPKYAYSMQKEEKLPSEVILGGELLQINMRTNKVMFYSGGDIKSTFKNFDLIYKIEEKNIQTRDDIFKMLLSKNDKNSLKIVVLRNKEFKTLIIDKKEINISYFTEFVPFSATLTYINPEDNTFGAVGHNIKVPGLEDALSTNGNIYLCNMLQIKKSSESEVGSIHGQMINKCKGKVTKVNDFGAKGFITEDNFKDKFVYQVGRSKDVKLGNANLVISNSNENTKKFYDINIIKVNNQNEPTTQGFEFEIVDKEFIKEYGGILQGMSGSPIVQNGKIIGALSHVIANDTDKGIGLYIEWMMEK